MKLFVLTIVVYALAYAYALEGPAIGIVREPWRDAVAILALEVFLGVPYAKHMYKKAIGHKRIWAAFGFLGNVNAYLWQFAYQNIYLHWRSGKKVVG